MRHLALLLALVPLLPSVVAAQHHWPRLEREIRAFATGPLRLCDMQARERYFQRWTGRIDIHLAFGASGELLDAAIRSDDALDPVRRECFDRALRHASWDATGQGALEIDYPVHFTDVSPPMPPRGWGP